MKSTNSSDKTRARLLVLAIFVFGFAAGALSMNLLRKVTAVGAGQQLPQQEKRERYIQLLKTRLNLTPAQETQIRAVVNDCSANIHEAERQAQQQSEPVVNAARQRGRDRIRALLTPDQLPKFDAVIADLDRQRKERETQK